MREREREDISRRPWFGTGKREAQYIKKSMVGLKL